MQRKSNQRHGKRRAHDDRAESKQHTKKRPATDRFNLGGIPTRCHHALRLLRWCRWVSFHNLPLMRSKKAAVRQAGSSISEKMRKESCGFPCGSGQEMRSKSQRTINAGARAPLCFDPEGTL